MAAGGLFCAAGTWQNPAVPDQSNPSPVPHLAGAHALADLYDGFVLDLWGVIHDGVTLYPGVAETLERLTDAGKKFVMLSNAPRRADTVSEAMVAMGMPDAFCRQVMSSGEATWIELRTRTDPWYAGVGDRCYHMGPDRDLGLLEGLDLVITDNVEDADLVLNTGPWRDNETVADYETVLQAGAERSVPMVCANPDLVVIRGGKRIICAGALAARYEEIGGKVRYLGKPHASIYAYCFEQLGIADRSRIAAVGDSLRTDIAGAAAVGIDSVLVLGGIHGDEVGYDGENPPDPGRLAAFLAEANRPPVATLGDFSW